MNRVKLDTYIASLMESKQATEKMTESLYTFMNAQFKRFHLQIDKLKKQNDRQRHKIDSLNNQLHQSASHKHVEDILRECLEEVKRERDLNNNKTIQSYQGSNTARRAEESARGFSTRKSDAFINPSENTLATFRGKDKEYLSDDGEATVKMSDEWKGHEKRKIIEKFLSKDEIFFKIL